MLLYTNTRNDNVVSYYYYFARGRFLASSKSRLCTFIHLFIVCGVCVLANELDRFVGWFSQYTKWTSPPFRLRQYLQPSQSPVDLHKGHTATNYNHHRPRPVQSVFWLTFSGNRETVKSATSVASLNILATSEWVSEIKSTSANWT